MFIVTVSDVDMYTVCKSHPLRIYNMHRWSLVVLAPEFQCRIHQSYQVLNCQWWQVWTVFQAGERLSSRVRKSTSEQLCCGPVDWMPISCVSALGAFLQSVLEFSSIWKESRSQNLGRLCYANRNILAVHDWIYCKCALLIQIKTLI